MKTKRFLAFLLALVLMLSLTTPAYAETGKSLPSDEADDPSAAPVTDDTTAVADGVYLVGSMNNWQPSEEYEFSINPANSSEYMLAGIVLTAGAEFKAIEVVDGNWQWFPSSNDNYVVPEAQAGRVTIYFQK